jgi:DNA-binding SARP family transcriptional activator/tetratricopeptide (TPR) repeat protein
VRRGGVATRLPPGKQRAVLAALLLAPGRALSLDEMAEVLWGSAPPPSARATMQNYVKRVRQGLGPAAGSRIVTQPRGYLIQADPGEVDVSRFEAHLRAAKAAVHDGAWDGAAAEASAGLDLWRGEPLADVDSALLMAREVPRLAELRLQALEIRIDADLHLGRHPEVIAELKRLTSAHPLRERLHVLLMLALYRDGRQPEALAVYRDARNLLVEELGVEPGPGLRELHQRILGDDPALAAPEPASPPAAGARPGAAVPVVPRELPADVRLFTGRGDELAVLTGLLEQPGEAAPRTVVISGTAGVGKTALAVHWAHQAAGHFPDGQLYVNLRGYDPGQPVTAADGLSFFLRSLGVAGQQIPAEEAERAARYRSLLAGRRMLVVLDNAATAEQIRPLLPGTSSCAVVVTSRDSLAGLVARDGAARLDMDLLPLPDAVGLLRALIGARVDADPCAAAALAAQCCRLPLALRVAAELAAARAAAPLAYLVGELDDQRQRLESLDAGGDTRTAVRAVFSWSCRHLDARAARAFRLAGLHPGPAFDTFAMAALAGTNPDAAGRLLSRLARGHLIEPGPAGRYGMHDLLRAYARELAESQDAEAEWRSPLTRLFDYYLHAAGTAMDALYPAERHLRPPVPATATPCPPLAEAAMARSWLASERATLVALAALATEHGFPGHGARLAPVLFRYLDAGGYYDDAAAVCTEGLRAARMAADQAAEAAALLCFGSVSWRQGRYDDAAAHLRQATAIFQKSGDHVGEARALGNLGVVEACHGRYDLAASYHRRALALTRQAGDMLCQARALDNLAGVLCQQKDYDRAAECQLAALAIYRQLGDRHGEADILCGLGAVACLRDRDQQAAWYLRQAITVSRATGDRLCEARALGNLGIIEWRQGHYRQAARRQKAAVAAFRETGDRAGEAGGLNAYGEALLAAGDPAGARAAHLDALGMATRIGDRYQQARAHDGLGYACHATGETAQTRRHWQQALAGYTSIDAPDAADTRGRLSHLDEEAGTWSLAGPAGPAVPAKCVTCFQDCPCFPHCPWQTANRSRGCWPAATRSRGCWPAATRLRTGPATSM